MKKTDNKILSVAVAIIAKEFTELKGDVQSAALVEASQRILELDKQVEFAIEQLDILKNPELKAKHHLAREASNRLKSGDV